MGCTSRPKSTGAGGCAAGDSVAITAIAESTPVKASCLSMSAVQVAGAARDELILQPVCLRKNIRGRSRASLSADRRLSSRRRWPGDSKFAARPTRGRTAKRGFRQKPAEKARERGGPGLAQLFWFGNHASEGAPVMTSTKAVSIRAAAVLAAVAVSLTGITAQTAIKLPTNRLTP